MSATPYFFNQYYHRTKLVRPTEESKSSGQRVSICNSEKLRDQRSTNAQFGVVRIHKHKLAFELNDCVNFPVCSIR